jgi:hypothetical protein
VGDKERGGTVPKKVSNKRRSHETKKSLERPRKAFQRSERIAVQARLNIDNALSNMTLSRSRLEFRRALGSALLVEARTLDADDLAAVAEHVLRETGDARIRNLVAVARIDLVALVDQYFTGYWDDQPMPDTGWDDLVDQLATMNGAHKEHEFVGLLLIDLLAFAARQHEHAAGVRA